MKNKLTSNLFSFTFLLFILPLSVGLCSKKPETCHQSIRVVNNSEKTIYIGSPIYYLNSNGTVEVGVFDCCDPISPQDVAIIQVIIRRCLEEYSTPMSFYVLSESSSNIYTTQDSLYFVYNILKTIDLQALGVDSLVKTDYTVFYP